MPFSIIEFYYNITIKLKKKNYYNLIFKKIFEKKNKIKFKINIT